MSRGFILTATILFSIITMVIFQPAYLSSMQDSLLLEDFQEYNGNPFSTWSFREDYSKAASVYSIIEENGGKFLRGSTINVNNSVQLGKEVNQKKLICKNKINWDINLYPYISWEWRIKVLPRGGDENLEKTNDSAAAIYVVFPKNKSSLFGWRHQPVNWIKYVWSSTLPVGTVVSRKFSKFGVTFYEGRYIVVGSGNGRLEKWITFKRNILADYETYFGKKPVSNPIAVGILTDSNDTNSKAEADYDNIRACSN